MRGRCGDLTGGWHPGHHLLVACAARSQCRGGSRTCSWCQPPDCTSRSPSGAAPRPLRGAAAPGLHHREIICASPTRVGHAVHAQPHGPPLDAKTGTGIPGPASRSSNTISRIGSALCRLSMVHAAPASKNRGSGGVGQSGASTSHRSVGQLCRTWACCRGASSQSTMRRRVDSVRTVWLALVSPLPLPPPPLPLCLCACCCGYDAVAPVWSASVESTRDTTRGDQGPGQSPRGVHMWSGRAMGCAYELVGLASCPPQCCSIARQR
jgi:hypothetical protein